MPDPDGSGHARVRPRKSDDPLGELLAERSRDESAQAWGDSDDIRDEDYLRDVPPHHGG